MSNKANLEQISSKKTYSNYYKRYYETKLKNNPEFLKKRRARDRKEYWKNREKARKKYQKYILKEGVKEKRKEYGIVWRKKNVKKVKEYSKKYWLRNKQTIYAQGKNPNSHKKRIKKVNSMNKRSKRICPRCKKQPAKSLHHIVPREFEGKDNKENTILLCYDCHNKIEMFTYDLFIKKKIFSSDVLRGFIINKNFPIFNN